MNNTKPPICISLTHNQMSPKVPSILFPVEATYYYYSLPSKPELIAHTSTELWIKPWGAKAYLVVKELKPVGPHNLDCVWEPVVASTIKVYLMSQQVAWMSLDPVCIGYTGGWSFPVIIWVGVVPGSLSVSNIHIEICLLEMTLQVKLYKPVQTSNPTAQAIEPFTTTLSLPICSADTPNFKGTGSFFFIDSKHPGKLFLLTACHVLFHPDLMANEKQAPCSASKVTKKVFLLSDAALKEHIKAIKLEIHGKEICLTQLTARKQEVEGQDNEEAEEERASVECQEKDTTRVIAALNKLLCNIICDWGSLSS
ncbi:hypothetical protein FRC06_003116 [Ceratobasidium sp. 370]|nr:hypothetical protein FRC06_003116 [Ceratobasidium sp. 370]